MEIDFSSLDGHLLHWGGRTSLPFPKRPGLLGPPVSLPQTLHGTAIYADQARGGFGGQWGGIYDSPMECLGTPGDLSFFRSRHNLSGCPEKTNKNTWSGPAMLATASWRSLSQAE